MIARLPRTQLVILVSSLFAVTAQAQSLDQASSNFYKLVVDNATTQVQDLIEVYVSGKQYFILKQDADLFKLAYTSNDVTTIQGQLVVKLNNLGSILDQGGDLILHANPANLETVNYNFQNNIVQTPREYKNSAFMNYSTYVDAKSANLNTSFYKTFSNAVLYNLNTTLTNRGKNALVDIYREQYFSDKLTTLRIGTGFSTMNSLTNPVSFAGVQYRKNYSLDSSYLVAPYLTVAGTAEVKSVAEIYVNEQSVGKVQVNEGPFNFTNLTAGQTANNEVRVVLKDLNGNVQSVQNMSLIGAPQNLKKGTDNFGFEAGRLRSGYSDLGPLFASGTYAYGLTDRATVEGHLEATKGQTRIAGAITYATPFGTVKYGAAIGKGEFLQKAQYNYQNGNFYTNLAVTRSKDFTTFGNAKYAIPNQFLATTGYRFKNYSLTGSLVKYGNAKQRASLNLVTNLGRGTLNMAVTRQGSNNGISFAWNTPIGKTNEWRSGSFFQHDSSGNTFNQSVTRSGGYDDWSLQANINHSPTGATSAATYQYAGEQAIATVYGTSGAGYSNFAARVDGAVVFDKGIHATRQIFQGYAVVDAGTEDLPISLNNTRVATTGKDGIAIVPNTNTMTSNTVGVPADQLPIDYQIDDSNFSVSSQAFFKSDVVIKVKKSPVVLVPEIDMKGIREVQIDGKKFAVIKQGVFFDDYKPGQAYELEVRTCKMKFIVKNDATLNEEIPLHCEK